MKCSLAFPFLFSLCLFPFSMVTARTAEREQSECVVDTIILGNAEVRAYRDRSGMKFDAYGGLTWDMKMLQTLPKIMGNADPVRYLQMMPGVQTCGEYRCGINVQGCDNGHNMVSIDGIPLYNVNHLLGFFSTFNSSHYTSMSIERTPCSSASPNRVGAHVVFSPSMILPDSVSGEVSVGIISSQGTLSMPLGRKRNMSLLLSGRTSYINMIYGGWMSNESRSMDYSFHDVNLTWMAKPSAYHTIKANLYYGNDKGSMDEKMYGAQMDSRWGNMAAGIQWLYDGKRWQSAHHLWVTAYRNRFKFDMQNLQCRLPSGIGSVAYKGEFSWKKWQVGAEVVGHRIEEQQTLFPEEESSGENDSGIKNACEAAVFAELRQPLSPSVYLNVGIRGSIFSNGGKCYVGLDPSATMIYEKDIVRCSATYALRHQYLHFTGISDAGLPIEYWMGADEENPPQTAHSFALNAGFKLWQKRYRVDVGVFCKLLQNQVEYNGSIFDCVSSNYEPKKYVYSGKGCNYGFNVMLTKCSGRLTGWVSYAYTSAQRRFWIGGVSRKSPASHERPHEVDAVVSWSLSGNWSLGANMVYASGTPFTGPVAVVLLNGNAVTQYGPHNANRLSPYFRTDVSANYKWKGKRNTEQGVNLSVYNATFRQNALFYSIRTYQDGSIAYVPTTFFFRALPSISYYIRF